MERRSIAWALSSDATGRLLPGERLTLAYYCHLADRSGIASPTVNQVAEQTGIGASTVRKHLSALRKSGHLIAVDVTDRPWWDRSTAYRVNVGHRADSGQR